MLGLAGAALATLVSALTLEFGVILKRACNHQALKLVSVLRPIIPVLLSLVPMFLTAHWLNLYWPVNSLLALALQCMVAGVIFLAVACMVVIRSDERRRVFGRIADWNSQRRLKQCPGRPAGLVSPTGKERKGSLWGYSDLDSFLPEA